MTVRQLWFTTLFLVLGMPGLAGATELRTSFLPAASARSLLDEPDPIPLAMRSGLSGDVTIELRAAADLFATDVLAPREGGGTAFAGGGGRAGNSENAWLAFILGLVPGFGLGHFLIAHDSPGGTRWLVVDIIFVAIWLVLDVAVGAAYPTYGYYCTRTGCYQDGGWGLWWLLFDLLLPVGWIVEHVFQGLSAYRAATGRSLLGETEPPPASPSFAAEPRHFAPNLFSWGF